jgi:hypothetical protein
MRIYFSFLIVIFIMGCKSKDNQILNSSVKEDVSLRDDRKVGKISHQYNYESCGSVIIVREKNKELILAPVDKLEKEIDVEGTLIRFHYQRARKIQKEGCSGFPAIISDIEMTNSY